MHMFQEVRLKLKIFTLCKHDAHSTLDIMECMANSDNVIRAGLTPKLRDIPNLVSGLTYAASLPSKHVVNPTPYHNSTNTTLYDPPAPEFSVLRVKVEPGCSEPHPAVDGPSIAIVTEGTGTVNWGSGQGSLELYKGLAFFIGQGAEVQFKAVERLVVFRAFCS